MVNSIIIDTNVLKRISQGSQPLVDALKRLLKSGVEVYISRLAYKELVNGAATPRLRAQYRDMLAELKIQITAASAMAERINFLAGNM